jgi:hypothetical protein
MCERRHFQGIRGQLVVVIQLHQQGTARSSTRLGLQAASKYA